MYNSGNSSKNVTGASIVDGTVETVDIADDAVTADKLANSVNTDIATGVSGSTTAGDALPKTGGAMTGAITTNSTFDGVDVATRDGVLTTTTSTANAALPLAGGTMTGTIAGFESTGIDDNATSSQVYVTDTGLGVGVSTPDKLLEIKGNSGSDGSNTPTIKISDSSTGGTWSGSMAFGQIEFENLDGGGPGNGGVKASIVAKASTSSGTKSQLSLYTGNGTTLTEGLVIQNEGYVRPGTDNSYNLGTSSYRWKDAYIGGSVYLGGTAAANALDDYEEGTYNPVFTPSTSGSIGCASSANALGYTKVGNLVHLSGYLYAQYITSPVGNIAMTLPFTPADLTDFGGGSAGQFIIHNSVSANMNAFYAKINDATADATIYRYDAATSLSTSAEQVQAGSHFYVSITYKAA